MKALLVFPPVWDPKQPYLSLPSLAAYLRGHHVDVQTVDLNILSFHWMLEDSWAPRIVDTGNAATGAAAAVRQAESFYRMNSLRNSMASLHGRLASLSQLFHPTKIGLYSFRMAYGTGTADGLIRACEDESQNPYLSLWKARGVVSSLLADDPLLVGVSVPSIHQLIPAMTLARLLKADAPEVPVFLGGDTVSRFAPRLARLSPWWKWIDGVVTHEGERALLSLCRSIARGPDRGNVPNLLYREGTAVLQTAAAPPLEAGELPPPDFEGLPLDRYLVPEPVLPVQTSRGCYWGRCAFCSHTETIRRFRPQSAQAIVKTMKTLAARHGARHFVLTDNAIPAPALRGLADEILRQNLDVKWSCCARFDLPADPRLWHTAAQAGLLSAWFGLESGSPRELRLMRKGTTPAQAREVARCCLDAGAAVDLFIMVGFPGATREDVVETYSFITKTLPPGKLPQPLLAIGRFALDSCCDVARHPDDYGVTIDPSQEELPLNLPYHSRTGLQPEDASTATSWLINKLERLYPSFPLQVSDREAHSLLLRSCGVGMPETYIADASRSAG